MARELERLLLRVEGDTSKARQELRLLETRAADSSTRIGVSFGKSSDALNRMSKALRGAAVAGAVVGAATGLGMLVKRAIDTADAIGKAADRMGIGTDALQEYQFAADLAGVSTEKLDSAFDAFGKRLGELRAGTGTLTTFLGKFDEQLLQNLVTARNNEEALKIFFQALSRVENAADRAALSAAAFGRSAGVEMANLVREGADNLDQMMMRARDLGAVMDESLIRQAEQAKDNLTILSRVLGTQFNEAVLALTPSVIALSKEIIKALPNIRQFMDSFVSDENKSIEGMRDRLREVNDAIALLEKRVSLSMLPHDVLGRLMFGGTPMEKRLDGLRKTRAELERLIALQSEPADAAFFDDLGEAGPAAPPARITSQQESEFISKMETAIERGQKRQQRARAQALAFITQIRSERLRAANNEIELIRLQQQRQLDSLETLKLTEEEKAQARILINEAAELKITEVHKNAAEERERITQEEQREFLDQWSNTTSEIDSTLRNALRGSADGFEALRRIALSVLEDIALKALQTAFATERIGGGTSIGGAIVSGIGSLLGFAGGGSPPVNRPSIVGERGPEIFVPRVPGSIMPNAQTRAVLNGGAGGGIVIAPTLVIQGGVDQRGLDPATVRAIESQLIRIARDAVAGEIMNQQRPGGLLQTGLPI